MALIQMENVTKTFRIKQREKGRFRHAREFFHPQYTQKQAVGGVSLSIERGELVGYIGPNGAGKSTTLKMLTGILVPTSGRVLVDGREPYKNRKQNALHMGAVFGQRTQLLWDLPVIDAFDLHQKMYRLDEARYRQNRDLLVELLDLGGFLQQSARQLSLGQKMRANLALSMLHEPEILYLDEPTIGLDVLAKDRIRHYIREINRLRETTVILTTHDMADIEAVCRRLVLINAGVILYDGGLEAFKHRFADRYTLCVTFRQEGQGVEDSRFAETSRDGVRVEYAVRHDALTPGEALTLVARQYELTDLGIIETPIEQIIREIYQQGKVSSPVSPMIGSRD